jgi:hypothetical protein
MFLFVDYLILLLMFVFVGGGLSSDMARFIGPLGLSIALNGGMRRRPLPEPATVPERPVQARFMPYPNPRPSFQR